ncbi:hypothetical protein [Arthrobacter sp. TMS1-12-1]
MDPRSRITDHPIARPTGMSAVRETRRAHLPGLLLGAELRVPDDLREVSTRRLRILCNRTYQLLERDRPSRETRERYHELVEELERREAHAERSPEGGPVPIRGDALVLPFVPSGRRRRLRLPRAARVTAPGQDGR